MKVSEHKSKVNTGKLVHCSKIECKFRFNWMLKGLVVWKYVCICGYFSFPIHALCASRWPPSELGMQERMCVVLLKGGWSYL